jgi:hypothetical protein
MDFVVVWASKSKKLKEECRWTKEGGITWYRAGSKWSKKKTYYSGKHIES